MSNHVIIILAELLHNLSMYHLGNCMSTPGYLLNRNFSYDKDLIDKNSSTLPVKMPLFSHSWRLDSVVPVGSVNSGLGLGLENATQSLPMAPNVLGPALVNLQELLSKKFHSFTKKSIKMLIAERVLSVSYGEPCWKCRRDARASTVDAVQNESVWKNIYCLVTHC